jgi:putative heme transporter
MTSRVSTRASLLAITAGLVFLYLAVEFLWPLVLTLLVSGAVYYLLAPVVGLLERRGVPRLLGTVAGYILLVGASVVAFAAFVPRLYSQLEEFGRDLPGYAESVEAWLADQERTDPRLRDAIDSLAGRADEVAIDAVNHALGVISGFFSSLVAIFFGLIVGFYLLLSGPRLAEQLPHWFPPAQRARWVRFGQEASRVLAGYVRARLIASTFVGTSYGIAFALLGVDQAVLLGTLAGVLNLVPVVGPLLAAIPAILVAAFQGWPLVLAILIVMVVAQQVESAVVNPYLEGYYVRLPPAVIVLVAAAGAALAGIIGLLLAPPVAGLTRVALDVFYRESWAAHDAWTASDDFGREQEKVTPASGARHSGSPGSR